MKLLSSKISRKKGCSIYKMGSYVYTKVASTPITKANFPSLVGGLVYTVTGATPRTTILDISAKCLLGYIITPKKVYSDDRDTHEIWLTVDGVEYYIENGSMVLSNNGTCCDFTMRNSTQAEELLPMESILSRGLGLRCNSSLKIEIASDQTGLTTEDAFLIGYMEVNNFDGGYVADPFSKEIRIF